VSVPVQQLPLSDDPATGNEVRSLSDLRNDEEIVGAISIEPTMEDGTLFFATEKGEVKRIRVTDLPGLTAHAFVVMNVGDDRLGWAHFVDDEDEIILMTAEAQAIRFKVAEVRPMGLPAGGMRGIKLDDSDKVVGANVVRDGNAVWVITESGIAKSSPIAEYPIQGRAGSGLLTMKLMLGERLAAGTIATLDDLVVILTDRKFKVVKFRAAPHGARNTKGDYMISLGRSDRVRALTQIVRRPSIARQFPPDVSNPPGANGASEPGEQTEP
jgi:DNA gyrase subunit A